MRFSYHNPVKILFNIDCIEALKISKIESKKTLLLSTKSFAKTIEKLKIHINIDDIIFVPPNPELEFVRSVWNKTRDYTLIIALGGGSVIDCAKTLSIKMKYSEFYSLLTKPNPTQNATKATIIAIPTTAGTSAEITAWATIWESKNNLKHSLHLANLHCEMAIYDINLMRTMPQNLTINTALDALSHSVESIWNKNSNPISTQNALTAINLIITHLPNLSKNLDSTILREYITLASIHAGLAFSNTKTSLAHAISYPLTMKFDLPHGLACSFTLPILLKSLIQSPQNNARNVAISYLLPYQDKIEQLLQNLHIKTNFKDYGVEKSDIVEIFSNLNSRANNTLIDIETAKKLILSEYI